MDVMNISELFIDLILTVKDSGKVSAFARAYEHDPAGNNIPAPLGEIPYPYSMNPSRMVDPTFQWCQNSPRFYALTYSFQPALRMYLSQMYTPMPNPPEAAPGRGLEFGLVERSDTKLSPRRSAFDRIQPPLRERLGVHGEGQMSVEIPAMS
nr:hypothetical protein Iba_chr13aCG10370 [Ipomoea batatas]